MHVAFPENMKDIFPSEKFITLSGYLIPRREMHYLLPGSSERLISS